MSLLSIDLSTLSIAQVIQSFLIVFTVAFTCIELFKKIKNAVLNGHRALTSHEDRDKMLLRHDGDINTLSNKIDNLTKLLQINIENDKKRTIAMFRDNLRCMHKEFTEQGYVTYEGLKTFTEIAQVYEDAGGDDILHSKLLPDVTALPIKYEKKES